MPRARSESGFTLIELLVALAIFSLAVLALLNLAGENTRAGGRLQDRILAEVVLDNRAVETVTSMTPPALGQTNGQEQVAGRTWIWTRLVSRTADPDMLRIDIVVIAPQVRQPAARVTLFRASR
ncbi:type II secretion system protein GspI [Caulobacter sp. B11]|uniref:type II secretion system minor pseudopilin GspI n=1 Tax=Caulobacter sp. B11 TaxID=2048899 RepID=UPI000C12AA82|nr:type II secretion system minor pseudopilin GspI [Caulobacter sp. B11]PHY12465.1 type II secretion system protein GspI [Caulobacter sp. B11]